MVHNHEKSGVSQSISAKTPHIRKTESDRIPKITIHNLVKEKLFTNTENCSIKWKDPYIGTQTHFSATAVVTDGDESYQEGYIEFKLPDTTCKSVTFITTPGRFGGKRYWFKCTGSSCRKRISTLYLKDGNLACLSCHNLTYKSRNLSGSRKALGKVIPLGELARLAKAVKRFHYRDKPTKRFKAYIKKRNRSMNAFESSLSRIDDMFKENEENLSQDKN